MSRIRRLFLILILTNVAVLVLHSSLLAVKAFALPPVQVDDWVYQTWTKESSTLPHPMLSMGPIYLLIFWFGLEFFLSFYQGGTLGGVFVTILVISVLASVAGPMIGSITDQGRPRDFGFSVGGAKDVNNFRANIAAGCLPQPSDITFEGLFYDYRFDTGRPTSVATEGFSGNLFVPTYACAVSPDPLSGEMEHFLAVGLKSDLRKSEFSRKKLNLIVVLDISGSMESPFNRYYYGSKRERPGMNDRELEMTKLKAASLAITALLDQLGPHDRFGMVLFDHEAYLAKPVSTIDTTDVPALKSHILALHTAGATNMEAGLAMGKDLLVPFAGEDREDYENRIIFLTDAMPNTDDTSEYGLLGMTREMAEKNLFLTFIGMGIDFNSQLVESISKVRGANYYSVHSPGEFKKRLADEFDCMVSPMVFDLALTLKAPGFRIKEVYGSPEAAISTGRIMHVRTLFPSPTSVDGTRGGIILLKLEKTGEEEEISLSVTYEDRKKTEFEVSGKIRFPGGAIEQYDDAGIRKGILLARYAMLLKSAATKSWKRSGGRNQNESAHPDNSGWSYWERSARPLTVSAGNGSHLKTFQGYLDREIAAIGDQALKKESLVLTQLHGLVH
jgi:Ca-activated chloride channel family protein